VRPLKKAPRLSLSLLALLTAAAAGCKRSEQPTAGPESSAAPTEKSLPPPALTAAPPAAEPASAEPLAAEGPASAQPKSVAKSAPSAGRAGPAALASSAGRPAPLAQPSSSAAAPVVTGAPSAAEGFSVYLQARASYRRDEPSSVQAVLVAKDPFHCNEKYPYKFTLDPPSAGIKYDAQVVRGMSIGAKRSVMTIPFVASQSGQVAGELAFSVCTESKCLLEKRRLSVRVNVQ
jgi:hypothetical protein